MFFKKSLEVLKSALGKTRKVFTTTVRDLFKAGRKIDDELLEHLEETLIMADVGVKTTQELVKKLQDAYKNKEIQDNDEVINFLRTSLKEMLTQKSNEITFAPSGPTVILVVGVNGCGKTTSIAKLAYYFAEQGKKVMLAASDTFRAAAVEQLETWAQRLNVEIIRQKTGADPAAVAFDAVNAAINNQTDVLIVDTAGRLHTQKNLMQELGKIYRVIGKKLPNAPHEVLLVLDATTGQNAITQAQMFKQEVNVTGLILTKLDGTAKGGVVLAIQNQIDIPVKFIGLGEQYKDLEPFDVERFIDALLIGDDA
jgi:fused signal recognition particle receptor